MFYNNIDIDKLLDSYTPAEIFYKAYYEAKKDENTLNEFLSKLSADSYEMANYYIPELNCRKNDYFDETHLYTSLKDNIAVERHCRYTPPFYHAHSFFEMIYVYKGSCENTVEENKIIMKQGDICIVSPDVGHTIGVFDDSIIINILIKKTTFNETFFSLLADNNPLSCFFQKILYTNNADNYILFHTEGNEDLKYFLKCLIAEAIMKQKDSYSNMLLENMLCIVFGRILRDHMYNAEISSQKHTKDSHIVEILQYITDNYKTATLQDVACHYGYAVPYLSKLIKNATGSSYSTFIGDLRYKKACLLLANSDIPLHEICELSGYGSIEHFHRTFKRKSGGSTPLEYRKEHKSQ